MLETANIRLYQIGELKRLCCALVFVFRIDTDKVRFSVKIKLLRTYVYGVLFLRTLTGKLALLSQKFD